MARRRKAGELLESEVECYYCNAVIPARSMRCPSCKKVFSSAKKIIAFAVVLIVVASALSFIVVSQYLGGHEGYNDGIEPNGANGGNGTTSKIIKIELYTNQMPITAKNFIDLANQGNFNGVKFHRVINEFMIQGGDFTNGDGTGGHAAEYHTGLGDQANPLTWSIPDEFHPTATHERGVVSMANAGPNTGGSQFFIMQGADRPDLDSKHAIFGRVTSGMNFVDQIANLPNDAVTMTSVTISTESGRTYASIAVDL
ncbi:MAG: hypothetical protein AYK23_00845 [Candidatus Proteinoplasmatales archaeon SG8-5]|nr:MAG: hypothetical protein AYK23_00845 [Candidatus Proteinoplasmatales archaeon SG8-5]